MTTRLLSSSPLPGQRWSTSAFGQPVDTSPIELSALGEHLDLCQHSHGRFFALKCLAEGVHGFLGGRFVTTVMVTGVALGAVALLF